MKRRRSRQLWTRRQIAIMRRRYPHEPTRRLCREMKRTISSVYGFAKKLGVKKSAAYLARKKAAEAQRLRRSGVPYRFAKGTVPPNKGLRRPGYAPGRMRETQFKKGQRCRNLMPIGAYRIDSDGYLRRKISDTGYGPRDWEAVHRLVWVAANGPIPPGHKIAFRRGRPTTVLAEITVDALELLSDGEMMLRNSYHNNYPKEIGEVIRLRGLVQRHINRRAEAANEKQN